MPPEEWDEWAELRRTQEEEAKQTPVDEEEWDARPESHHDREKAHKISYIWLQEMALF